MTAADRPFTLARLPRVEERCAATLAALLSRLNDAAGEALSGAALGGALGRGESATAVDADGEPVAAAPFELLAVLETTPGRAASLAPRLARELGATARPRRAPVVLRTVARTALPHLPATLEAIECAASGRVVAGPEDLLAPLAPLAEAQPSREEALRLLVRRGAALLSADRGLSRRSAPRAALLAGRAAVRGVDLALGTALLVSARRFRPTEEARAAELRRLAAPAEESAPPEGLHLRMTRTRFRDVVERHREAFAAAATLDLPDALPEARAEAARTTDRFLELLRLLEEERLGRSLPSWTDYLRALAARRGPSPGAGLFGARDDEALPGRRAVRDWPPAERLAPALATLLDWDPGDLPIAPVLLDLPDDATREALGARLLALSAAA